MAETEEDSQKKWEKAANAIIKAGVLPFPVSETTLQIVKFYLTDEEATFVGKAFKLKPSQTMEQLIKSSKGMAEADIQRLCESLAKKGLIFNQPSSSGTMIYRLLPLEVTGAFEYTFMNKVPDGATKENYIHLAKLYDTLIEELKEKVQGAYDDVVALFKAQPAFDRSVAVETNSDGKPIEIVINEDVQAVGDRVLPSNSVKAIIEKFDDIAVGNCFCRNFKSLLGKKCNIDAPLEVCFTFGKSARHVIQQGFARKVSKAEALAIMKKADDAGLVHRTFHNKSDIFEVENSICNCCPDCCDGFDYWRRGALPVVTSTNHLSIVKDDLCVGCGTCENRCPVDAIFVNDCHKAEVRDERCIGCGVCASVCPEQAVALKETSYRTVFIPPPKLP